MSSYPCISCDRNISGRSHAIQCDVCDRWQHRKCGTACAITSLIKLPEKWRQKAREELGEDDKEVDSAIDTLRTWAKQEPWLRTPTDSDFLLRYLRARKFFQLEARKTLTNFWTNRTKNPEWFGPEVHPGNKDILDIIKTGFYLIIPGVDSQGRRFILERGGVLNMSALEKKHGRLDIVMQTVLCILDWFNMDERVQVNGNVHMIDASVATLDTMKLAKPSTYKRILPIVEKSNPNRLKGIHIYGLHRMFESLLQLCKALLRPKLRDRMHIHSNMVSVYGKIENHMLPREYLPDDYTGPCVGSIQDVVEYMVKDITRPEVVAHIKALNSGRYGVDLKLKDKSKAPAASFRKLNVD